MNEEERSEEKNGSARLLRVVTVLILLAGLFMYWFAARLVQGVDYSTTPPQLLLTIRSGLPLIDIAFPIFLSIAEMFDPSVLRHFIPIGFGIGLAYYISLDLVQNLYDLPNRKQASRLLQRLMDTQMLRTAEMRKPLPIDRRRFAIQRMEEELLMVGGPGFVVLAESDAAVTEINGRFANVLRPGKRELSRFEKIVAVIDLREQELYEQDVRLVTQEGLELTTDIYINFRIKPGPRGRDALIYTVNEEAVRQAAYATTRGDLGPSRWNKTPLWIAKAKLRQKIGTMKLADLIDPNEALPDAPNPAIQKHVEEQVSRILADSGIELCDLRITAFRMSESMRETLFDYYKAFVPKAQLGPAQFDSKSDTAHKRERDKMIKSLASALQNLREDRAVAARRASGPAVPPHRGHASSDGVSSPPPMPKQVTADDNTVYDDLFAQSSEERWEREMFESWSEEL